MKYSKERKKSVPVKIDGLLWQVLRQKGCATAVKSHQVVDQWEKIAGPLIASKTQASGVENGVLFLAVAEASWRNELVFLKKDLLEKINDFTGQQVIKDIIFTANRNQRKNEQK